ncbi:MAG TPA: hypothetical protein IGS17_10735 [Oscillatoriales cyanobacterium M59_W2019_021]|nr:hypothetical protein [Oscillatoriales cyanobacterium M4454_W2019_049]HIK51382.1 hypothetical protein [Oscillatoriales cyanobacterium M59_W2019_021]
MARVWVLGRVLRRVLGRVLGSVRLGDLGVQVRVPVLPPDRERGVPRERRVVVDPGWVLVLAERVWGLGQQTVEVGNWRVAMLEEWLEAVLVVWAVTLQPE